HREELVALEIVPHLRRQVVQLPIDPPVVEHAAELVDRAVEERPLLRRERRRRKGQKLRPVRPPGEQVGVPPDLARPDRLALGGGRARQPLLCPWEDRPGDEAPAKCGAHGNPWSCGSSVRPSPPRKRDFPEPVATGPRLPRGRERVIVTA